MKRLLFIFVVFSIILDIAYLKRTWVSNNINVDIDKNTDIVMTCKNGDSVSYIEVPRLNYKGYHVIFEDGTEARIKDGKYKRIRFEVPANYKGKIYVKFINTIKWIIADIISVIAWVILVLYIVIGLRRFYLPVSNKNQRIVNI